MKKIIAFSYLNALFMATAYADIPIQLPSRKLTELAKRSVPNLPQGHILNLYQLLGSVEFSA